MRLRSGRAFGIGLVAAGAVFWSTAGLFMRALHSDLWTILVWRSAFGALSLAAIVVIRHGRDAARVTRAMGRVGLAIIPVSAVSMVSYVAALKLTTVANVMMAYATLPFMAAGVAFLWGRERPKPHVLMASALALAGVGVIAGSATRWEDLAGNAVALLMTGTFAVILVMARRHPGIDMAPVNGAAALLCAAVCWPLSRSVPIGAEMATAGLFGITTSGVAYLLFLTGGRYIPSSEAGLVGFLDVVLGPLWAWLAFEERPGRGVFLGGGFIVAAVLWYLVREAMQPDASSASGAATDERRAKLAPARETI